MTETVKIVEVAPRDGLQNLRAFIPTVAKIAFIDTLSAAGFPVIEATSFVSPKWAPQFKDAATVFQSIHKNKETRYPVLVPNKRGFENATAAGANAIAIFTAASNTFCQKNINCSIEESLEQFKVIVDKAKQQNIWVRAYISCIVHCPYEEAIAPKAVSLVAEKLYEMGVNEISLGDTTGQGTPQSFHLLLQRLLSHVPATMLALHCHDTFQNALANIEVGLENGIRTFDAAVAGLGGCPYAPGASGNVATEAVVTKLTNMGYQSGIDIKKLEQAKNLIKHFPA